MGSMPLALARARRLHPGRIAAIAALFATALLIAGALILWRIDVGLAADRGEIARVRAEVDEAQTLMAAVQDAETGQRGFLLTRRPSYLEPLTAAERTLPPLIIRLQALTQPEDADRLRRISALVETRMEQIRASLAAARLGDMDGALDPVRTDRGKLTMDALRAEVTVLVAMGSRALDQRLAALERAYRTRTLTVSGFGTLAVLGLLGCALLLANGARRLQRAEAVVRSAMETMRDGLLAVGPDGVVRACNERFGEIAGMPPGMCREGARWAELVAHDAGIDPPLLDRPVGTVVRRGGKVLEIWFAPMEDGGQLFLLADISRRDAAEAIARNSQRMEAMGQLTGGVAHDFNNLLQVIGGNLDLALRAAPESLRPRLEAARGGVERGARLTQHLLAFGRRQPLAPQPTDPNRLVSGMEELLRRTLGGQIELQTVIAAGAWATMVDPVQLESAVLNLALNARDAMPDGGRLTIEVSNVTIDAAYAAQVDVPPGDYVMVAVGDTGTGMTPEVQARAFEPFFTTKPEGKGTGLGLAMVYGFTRQSGGHVRLYSEPGAGSTIKLFLPRAAHAPVEARAAPPPPRTLAARVLVVEDDAPVRAAASALFRDLGATVEEAAGMEAALALLEAGPFDLLFTDMVMPGEMSIRDFVQRAQTLQPGIAVLYTSGYTQNGVVHGGRLDPGVRLLTKPYARDDLARAAAAALADARAARPLRILYAEDEALVRLATLEMLQADGHTVREAASCAEADAWDEDGRPDLVICDIELPDGNGIALVRQMRVRWPGLPVIIASGRRPSPLPADLVWLDKPYEAQQLRVAILSALESAPSA